MQGNISDILEPAAKRVCLDGGGDGQTYVQLKNEDGQTYMLAVQSEYIDGLVQERCNSSVLAHQYDTILIHRYMYICMYRLVYLMQTSFWVWACQWEDYVTSSPNGRAIVGIPRMIPGHDTGEVLWKAIQFFDNLELIVA